MNILFITFGELSASVEGGIRPVSTLLALADAGHQVYVIAAHTDIPEHPHIIILAGNTAGITSRWHLRCAVFKATGSMHFDAVHAVDDAIICAAKICRLRKIRLIYSAERCFTGSVGQAPSRLWKWFPEHYRKVEKRILKQALSILTPCSVLRSDIAQRFSADHIFEIADVPLQTLFGCREADRTELLNRFEGATSSVVVCSIPPDRPEILRKVLIAARKVIDALPGASFFLKSNLVKEAEALAESLDIQKRCFFLDHEPPELFLAALDNADVVLLVPASGVRYVNPEVYTLLQSPAPLVAVQEGAYSGLLTEQNSIEVVLSSESISEGILRVIQEPLFSIGLGAEGQQLIADRFSLSSFKHKIRMAYHEMMK